jgi:hypothetical protein
VVCVVLCVCLHECKCIKHSVVSVVCVCLHECKYQMAIIHEPCQMYTVNLTRTHTHTGVRDAGGGDSARAGLHRNDVGGPPCARQVLQPGLVEGEKADSFCF